jgi:hypothetical protein
MARHALAFSPEREDAELRAGSVQGDRQAHRGAHWEEVVTVAPKSARAHVNGGESGIEFQGYSTPGVAL